MSRYTVEYRLTAQDHVSDELRDIKRAFNDVDKEARGLGAGMRDAFGFDVGAVDMLETTLDVARNMQALGSEVNKIRAPFNELSTEVGGATVVLDAMRLATNGVVDDMSLMTSANSLLLTGVADSADQLAFMTSGAIKLGAAMRQDAVGSIQNLNSALLNMSYERLDTLGVSASEVRKRVKELNAAGMETGEAFNVAVLEEMEVSLGRLGDAADASATQVEILTTKMTNLYQDWSGRFSMGVEGVAGFTNLGLDAMADAFAPSEMQLTRERIREAAEGNAAAYYEAFVNDFDDPRYDAMIGAAVQNSDMVRLVMASQMDAIEQGLELPIDELLRRAGLDPNNISAETQAALDAAANYVYLYDPDIQMTTTTGNFGGSQRDRERGLVADTLAQREEALALLQEQQRVQQAYEDSLARSANDYLGFLNSQAEAGSYQLAFSDYSNSSAEAWQQINGLAASAVREFNGIPIASQAAANEAQRLADQTQAAYDAAQDLGVEGDELEGFRLAADDAQRLADEIDRAAINLSTMDARGMFGGRDDPSMNFLDDVLGDAGVSDQRRMLATGVITDTELDYDAFVAPVLAQLNATFGEEAAVAASERFVAQYTSSLESGLSESEALARASEAINFALSPSGQLAYTGPTAMDGAMGFGEMVGGMMGDQMGEGGTFADRLGSVEALEERSVLLDGIREDTMAISEATPPDLSPMVADLTDAHGVATELSGSLEQLSARTYTVAVIIETEIRGQLPGGAATIAAATIADSEV